MVPQIDLPLLVSWAERRALALFPLPAHCKRPGPAAWFRSHATDWSRDPAQWRAWWTATGGCNYGVECGPSGLIVGDVDEDQNGAPMYDEFWASVARCGGPLVATPGGGRHSYTQLPQGVVAPGCRPWIKGRIDIRAGAAYVVAPWCRTLSSVDPTASDGVYSLLADGEMPAAPPELIAHCSRVEAPEPASMIVDGLAPDGLPIDPGSRLQVEARVEGLLEALGRVEPGSRMRNATLNETAFDFGKLVAAGLLARGLAETRLRDTALMIGLETKETRDTIRSGLRGAQKSPETPRPSLYALLAAAAPAVERPVAWRPEGPKVLSVPQPPIVERLLLPGCVTVLSGRSGTGKTTIGASLMAASVSGLTNFDLPGAGLDAPRSDVVMRPAAWVFVSWEGGQWIDAHMRAWRIGCGGAEAHPERVAVVSRRAPWVCADGRRVVVDKRQTEELGAAIDAVCAACPGLPLVVALDNATSAIEDPMDPAQASALMRMMAALAAERDAAVLLMAHPPKSGHTAVYGSHVFVSLADVVGELEVLRRDGGEWTQWVSFAEKHRPAPNGRALELRSRRLDKPILDLPSDWGGDPRGRDRALEDLRLPWIRQVRVRWDSEREATKNGASRVTEVTPKPAVLAPVPQPPRERPPHGGEPAVLFQFPGRV